MNYIIDESGKQIFCASKAYYMKEGLCAVQIGGKWGFINTLGKIVIPCQYDKVWGVEKGTTVVMSNEKFGLINKSGKIIVPLQYKDYKHVPKPYDGVVSIDIGTGNNLICKCVDIEGRTLFTKQAFASLEFSEGVASLWDSHGYSVIDKSGNQVIPSGLYDFICDFKEGVARVTRGSLKGYINKYGEIVVPLQYSSFSDETFPIVLAYSDKGVICLDARTGTNITPFSEDKDRYKISAFMNTDGMAIIDVKDSDTVFFYDIVSRSFFTHSSIKKHWRFSNGLCAIISKKNGQSGFIDKTGVLVLPYDFEEDSMGCHVQFHRGCCALNDTFINKKGEVLRRIPPRHEIHYSSLNVVEDGLWIESGPDMLTSKYGKSQGEALLNEQGKIVYTGYSIESYTTSSLIPVKGSNLTSNEKWGYINREGKLVIPYQFTDHSSFSEGFTTVDEPPRSVTKEKGCYIATSVYGSYDAPNVWVLRRFRDICLSNYAIGRAFIQFYYRISPILVKIAGDSKLFNGVFKPLLDRFVRYLRTHGYSDSPYAD